MIKKFTLFYLVVLFSGILYAQITPPTLGPGEFWTRLWTLSYDYQTNGSVRYLIQDPTNPDNLCAILMATHDSTSPAGTNRYVWYTYSDDGGRTWGDGVEVTTAAFNGFPSLSTRSGQPLVGFHVSGTPTSTRIYEDVTFGAGSWSQLGTITPPTAGMVWPHIAGTTNGNIVVAAAPNPGFQANYTYWNGTAWSTVVELANTGGPSGNFSVESGPGGLAYIHGIDYNSPATAGNRLWTSNNNGQTFTEQTGSNAPPFYVIEPNDTLMAFVDGGRTGIYVGNDIHLVYTVYANSSEALANPPNTVWFKKAKILHWSSATGVDTVAGRFNMPNMTDTLTHALVTPVCQPSLGIYNGILYCTFVAFLRGNTQVVGDGSIVNAGEIFLTYSVDNGNTWSTPANITNTPAIEEKHPSVARNFTLPAGDSVGVFYFRDLKAGGWVNIPAWGPAPGYGIYRKLGGNLIGIKQDLEVAREYELFQNYPNPFNPTTTISYYLKSNGNVSLKVYNVLGALVTTLVNGYQTKGPKEINFNANNYASGVYYYTIETEGFRDTKKMILMK
jgi:hypothetical protein